MSSRLSQRFFSFIYGITDPYKHLRELSLPQGLSLQLRETLMKHQSIGVAWLHSHGGRGVILADDMGLGKTLQVLAYLLATKQSRTPEEGFGAALVVCPPTLLSTWLLESQKWTPDLKTVIWRGKNKENLLALAATSDVVIVSYDAMARYVSPMSEIPIQEGLSTSASGRYLEPEQESSTPEPILRWSLAIFDEAQLLKNAGTKRHKAAQSLTASGKLALTGTPIENSIGDLYCLFKVVNPKIVAMWDKRGFVAKFRHRLDELRDLTRPYILARSKKRLRRMLGLPKRLHQSISLEMPPQQMAIYQQVARGSLANLKGENSFTRIHVFALLTQLKQVCNSPALVGAEGPSAKIAWFTDKLQIWEEPVVVFTQYKRMIEPLSKLGQKLGWSIYQIEGSMSHKARTDILHAWKHDANPKKLFLISLRAGGTGLTLTESRIVVHFDRWWNPAVEDQASDRTYRIGQKKDVTIYTLTCLKTLEEKIDLLISDKRTLQEVIETQDEEAIKKLVLLEEPETSLQGR